MTAMRAVNTLERKRYPDHGQRHPCATDGGEDLTDPAHVGSGRPPRIYGQSRRDETGQHDNDGEHDVIADHDESKRTECGPIDQRLLVREAQHDLQKQGGDETDGKVCDYVLNDAATTKKMQWD